jgi:hypothetical protein
MLHPGFGIAAGEAVVGFVVRGKAAARQAVDEFIDPEFLQGIFEQGDQFAARGAGIRTLDEVHDAQGRTVIKTGAGHYRREISQNDNPVNNCGLQGPLAVMGLIDAWRQGY